MKKIILLFAVCCLLPASSLLAFGKKDAAEAHPINNEWILCVTAFDYSQLPVARHIAGDVIVRNLVDRLQSVNYRLRISPEYAYYESYAWQQSINAVSRSISLKQDERALLLYRGEPDWRYRRNLQRIDADLAKLYADLAKIEAEKPIIDREPLFKLSQANTGGTYPSPPKPGTERRFCQSQKSDAFLVGAIREFHGRYYIKLELYALYTNAYIYEDDIIFSLDDTAGAVEEISARLSAALSGNKNAAVAIRSDPLESQILINQNYAGRGTVPAREYPPGRITIAVAAEGYSPQNVETELAGGELAEIDVNLIPLEYAEININIPDRTGVSIYQGSLYVGEAPLTLRLPVDQLKFITAETPGGEEAKVVFTTPDFPGETFDLSLVTKRPPPLGLRRVNNARARYYWAWGGTWITGIAAWISYGVYSGRSAVLSQSNSPEFYDSTRRIYYVSTGAMVLLGAAVVHEIYQMYRYLGTAMEGATPIFNWGKTDK